MKGSSVVVVGCGMAAVALVKELRKLDAAVPLTILTMNDGSVYSKPRISNALSQHASPASIVQMTAETFAVENDIKIVTGCTVERIDPLRKVLHTTAGSFLYTSLVLATGSEPKTPNCEGGAEPSCYTLDSLDSYALFRDRLTPSSRILVLGAGLVGSEIANDLASARHTVTLVEAGPYPLASIVPRSIGLALQQALAREGVRFMFRRIAQRLDHSEGAVRVTLSDETQFEIDLVISAIGAMPRVALAARAGIAVARGIVVDNYLTTSNPYIYALGDCAEVDGVHMPYVPPLLAQARALAQTLSGNPTQYHPKQTPIVVKTPAVPVIVCPPLDTEQARWSDRVLPDGGVEALCTDGRGTLIGFALTGSACAARRTLTELLARQAPKNFDSGLKVNSNLEEIL